MYFERQKKVNTRSIKRNTNVNRRLKKRKEFVFKSNSVNRKRRNKKKNTERAGDLQVEAVIMVDTQMKDIERETDILEETQDPEAKKEEENVRRKGKGEIERTKKSEEAEVLGIVRTDIKISIDLGMTRRGQYLKRDTRREVQAMIRDTPRERSKRDLEEMKDIETEINMIVTIKSRKVLEQSIQNMTIKVLDKMKNLPKGVILHPQSQLTTIRGKLKKNHLSLSKEK